MNRDKALLYRINNLFAFVFNDEIEWDDLEPLKLNAFYVSNLTLQL